MFLYNWTKQTFVNILQKVGLKQRTKKVLVTGLDQCGKTTLFHILTQNNEKINKYNQQTFVYDLQLVSWTLGQYSVPRDLWKSKMIGAQGIVYIVDASDPQRFSQSKKYLQQITNMKQFSQIPIVVFGNKIDKKNAVLEEQLRDKIDLPKKNSSFQNSRHIEIFMCTLAKRMGYQNGLKWLSQNIN